MPNLAAPSAPKPVRILLVSDPGGGKTTSYLHLAEHGYKLFVADFDNGVTEAAKRIKPEARVNVCYEPIVDKVRPNIANGFPQPVGNPTAWRKFMKLTDKWVDSSTGQDYGAPETWDANSIFVVDNLTSMGNAVAFAVQYERGQLGSKLSLNAVHEAQLRVEGVPQAFLSFPVSTIMLAHLAPMSAAEDVVIEDKKENDDTKEGRAEAKATNPNTYLRYPYTLGRKLSRRIAGYFTAVLYLKQVGSGRNARPVICTVPDPDVGVKVPALNLPPEMPITDLHKIIEAIRNV